MVRYSKDAAKRGQRYIEDRRGQSPRRRGGFGSGGFGGGRGGGLPIPTGRMGGGMSGLILIVIILVFAYNACNAGGSATSTGGSGTTVALTDEEGNIQDEDRAYMGALMLDIQDTWAQLFEGSGQTYVETKMVLFNDVVDTGCGQATSAVGPFYCPAPGDNKVYIDLGFYDELATRFGAPGDFAQAYVIAHEVGHHVQSITGASDRVRQAQAQDPANKNQYSIMQELQADCYAGVWAYHASNDASGDPFIIIEPGDIEEGLAAAAAVGDDRIQQQSGMSVDPHTWTHGSAEQRMEWFTVGYESGDPNLCDPFS